MPSYFMSYEDDTITLKSPTETFFYADFALKILFFENSLLVSLEKH